MSNYTEHYHPNSQVSVEEMDNLYTVLDNEQAAIIAHAKLVGKNRTYRMPVNQHPADIAAALNEAKAEVHLNQLWRFDYVSTYTIPRSQIDGKQYPHEDINYFAAVVLARQIVAHL